MEKMKKYRVGIIGCGRMGWLFNEDNLAAQPISHIAAYMANERFEVVSVCDIDSARLRRVSMKYAIRRAYADYTEMLARESLDIVSICTPTATHSTICADAARSGLRLIFCEKPISSSLEEADKMISVCKRNNVRLVINHTRRWDTSFCAAKKLLEKGVIGAPSFAASFSQVGLLNGGTHLFDLLRSYFGDVESVSGTIIPDESTDPGGRGLLDFAEGPACFVDACWREYVLFGVDIYGDKGVIRVGGRVRSRDVVGLFIGKKSKNESGIKELEAVSCKMPKWKTPILCAVDNIAGSLRRNEKIACTGEDGRAALEIAMAFHESSRRNGIKVALPLKRKNVSIIPRYTSFTRDGMLK